MQYHFLRVTLIGLMALLASFTVTQPGKVIFPYGKAGLTERQAAAHLISRFTFGAKPQQVDEAVATGIEDWFAQQLKGEWADETVQQKLKKFDALKFTNAQVVAQFPRTTQVRKQAVMDGIIGKDSLGNKGKAEVRQKLQAYRQQKGWRNEKELFQQFISQKIFRAAYGQNQMHEVLTDFWFNHFNVSVTKPQCAQFIPAYERDVIRPNVIGKFADLLMATAQAPAMLLYLDNFNSAITNEDFENKTEPMRTRLAKRGQPRNTLSKNKTAKGKRKEMGLNENYAREIMELHTMGVDGGYTQQDVTEAARMLTGWTIYPFAEGYNQKMHKMLEKMGPNQLAAKGFVHNGDFLFAINRHDSKQKTVLGKTFKSGGGYEEGVELLNILAHHPSTAKFISKKLATRFVSDTPPESLINKMADTFLKEDGDISKVLLTMVQSIEFWSEGALRAKTKSPFEYAISTLRALNADVSDAWPLFQALSKMGQKLYSYAAPTGFPDRAQYWINTGSLLNRMNFGLALASNRIRGVQVNLGELNNHQEPESTEAALITYAQLMMPERNLQSTYQRLTPVLNHQSFQEKLLEKEAVNKQELEPEMELDDNEVTRNELLQKNTKIDNAMLSHVVGIIIGSPEFQRR